MSNEDGNHLSKVREFYRKNVLPYTGKPKGCSLEEVSELQSRVGFALPAAYKQYLEWMGRDTQGVFVGSEWFIDDVFSNREALAQLFTENHITLPLPENLLCFSTHQGYMAAWFELPKSDDDPPVWIFVEEQMECPQVFGRFTDFLLESMKGIATSLENGSPFPKRHTVVMAFLRIIGKG